MPRSSELKHLPIKRHKARTNADRAAIEQQDRIVEQMALGMYGEDNKALALKLLRAKESYVYFHSLKVINKLKRS